MSFPLMDACHLFPCPDCQAAPGQWCYPRGFDDHPWCHTERREVMVMNSQPRFTLVSR